MELTSTFQDFVSKIDLPEKQAAALSDAYNDVKKKVEQDSVFRNKKAIISVFQQGSVRRHTAVAPVGDQRADLDTVITTRLKSGEKPGEYTPQQAFDFFRRFLDEHYAGQWKARDRSILIQFENAEVDFVITSKPDEAQEGIVTDELVTQDALQLRANSANLEVVQKSWDRKWGGAWSTWSTTQGTSVMKMSAKAGQVSPDALEIPDRQWKRWEHTHPIAQIQWTQQKNGQCMGHYLGVVRSLKYWRRLKHPDPKYPKGYPLEHMIGANCPNGISSHAEGIARTLENITKAYAANVSTGTVPVLNDHGVEQNVLARLKPDEFARFHRQVGEASIVARAALDSKDREESLALWRQLFGDEFGGPVGGHKGPPPGTLPPPRGFTTPTAPARVRPERYARFA